MTEHLYSFRHPKSSWWIYIDIFGDIEEYNFQFGAMKVAERIWIKYADKPITEHEIFFNKHLPFLAKGLQIVKNKIYENTPYKNVIIIIKSLQYNPTDFQEEGLTVAIMEWAAKAFGFKKPIVDVDFLKAENRYVFDFHVMQFDGGNM